MSFREVVQFGDAVEAGEADDRVARLFTDGTDPGRHVQAQVCHASDFLGLRAESVATRRGRRCTNRIHKYRCVSSHWSGLAIVYDAKAVMGIFLQVL